MADTSKDLLFRMGADVEQYKKAMHEVSTATTTAMTEAGAAAKTGATAISTAGRTMGAGVEQGARLTTTALHSIVAGTKEVEASTKKMSEVSFLATQNLAMGFTSVGEKMMGIGMGIGKSVVATAASFQRIEFQLTNVYKSATKAKDAMAWIKTMAVKTPFEVEELAKAAVKLEVLGNSARQFLPLAVDLAGYMGVDLVETSQAMSKALAGSAEGWESLRNNFGITGAKLKEFGAVLTNEGNVAFTGVETIKKNAAALSAYLQKEMAGSADKFGETYAGKMSNLSDSITALKETLGKELLPVLTSAAKSTTLMIDNFNKLSPEARNAAISAVGLAVAIGGLSKVAGVLIGWWATLKGLEISKYFAGSALAAGGLKFAISEAAIGFRAYGAEVAAATASGGRLKGVWAALSAQVIAGSTAMTVAAAAIPVAIGLAIAGLQRMQHEAAKAEWEFKQSAMGETFLANRAIGIQTAYELEGKSVQEKAAAYKKAGMAYEDVIKAVAGVQQMRAAAKTDEEKKKYDNLRESLQAVAVEYKTVGKTVVEVAEQQNQASEISAKAIEHKLTMGTTTKRGAAGEYSGVISGLQSQLSLISPTTTDDKAKKQRDKIQDDLWQAQERQKALNAEAVKDEATASKKSVDTAKKTAEEKKKINDKYLDDIEYYLTNLDKELQKGITTETRAMQGLKKVENDLKAEMSGMDRYSPEYQKSEKQLTAVQEKIQSMQVKASSVTIVPDTASTAAQTTMATSATSAATALDKLKTSTDAAAQAQDQKAGHSNLPSNFRTIADMPGMSDTATFSGWGGTVSDLGKPSGLVETRQQGAATPLNEALNNQMALLWSGQNKPGAQSWEAGLAQPTLQTRLAEIQASMSPGIKPTETVASRMAQAGLTSGAQGKAQNDAQGWQDAASIIRDAAQKFGEGIKIDLTVNGEQKTFQSGSASADAMMATNYSKEAK